MNSNTRRVSLNWSKLLGYSQLQAVQGTKNCSAKQAKIGAKIGMKVGVKLAR